MFLIRKFYVRKFVIERTTVVYMHPDWSHATTELYLELLFVELRWMFVLILRLLISYIYGAPSKARNANVVYIWTYIWQR